MEWLPTDTLVVLYQTLKDDWKTCLTLAQVNKKMTSTLKSMVTFFVPSIFDVCRNRLPYVDSFFKKGWHVYLMEKQYVSPVYGLEVAYRFRLLDAYNFILRSYDTKEIERFLASVRSGNLDKVRENVTNIEMDSGDFNTLLVPFARDIDIALLALPLITVRYGCLSRTPALGKDGAEIMFGICRREWKEAMMKIIKYEPESCERIFREVSYFNPVPHQLRVAYAIRISDASLLLMLLDDCPNFQFKERFIKHFSCGADIEIARIILRALIPEHKETILCVRFMIGCSIIRRRMDTLKLLLENPPKLSLNLVTIPLKNVKDLSYASQHFPIISNWDIIIACGTVRFQTEKCYVITRDWNFDTPLKLLQNRRKDLKNVDATLQFTVMDKCLKYGNMPLAREFIEYMQRQQCKGETIIHEKNLPEPRETKCPDVRNYLYGAMHEISRKDSRKRAANNTTY